MTPELLRAATGCTAADAARFVGSLTDACAAYDIDTPPRLAAFLAQIGHESGGLRHTRELWGPTPPQARYEGRADLGNTQPGDGSRYRGRGLIQTTGRYNHCRVRDRLRAKLGADRVPDFEATPEALEEPRWSAWSAADYWDDKALNALADAGQFTRITQRINGGLNGQADREARHARALAALAVTPTPPAATPPPVPLEESMPVAPFIAAALPYVVSAIPALGKLFGSGSEVSERNVKAAELAVQIAQDAVGAKNAQELTETLKADPAAAQTAQAAVASRWLELTEAGGGGIEGARQADAAARGTGGVMASPSMWALIALLPMAYLTVISVMFNLGGGWPSDVRAALATGVVTLIVGGAAGYYWGSTTSRNRTSA
jgi:putative chitinase